jgi:hypothetical protein
MSARKNMKILFMTLGASVGLSILPMSAQLTNRVEITPRMSFELLKDKCLVRGDSLVFTNRFESSDKIVYLVTNTSAQVFSMARILPRERQFEFHLFTQEGKEVEKSALGLKNTKDVALTETPRPRQLKLRFMPMEPGGGLLDHLFVPDDYFVITNKGTYTLEVRIRLWAQKTNGQYGVIISPPVRVQIERH